MCCIWELCTTEINFSLLAVYLSLLTCCLRILPWRVSLIASRKIRAPSSSAIPRLSSITVPHRWSQTLPEAKYRQASQNLSGVLAGHVRRLEDATLNRGNVIRKEEQKQWNRIGKNNKRKKFYTQTHRPFYRHTSLHRNTFSHRPFYTQTPSHRDAFTHRPFCTQTLLHTNIFTQKCFYTQTLLHTDTFTQTLLHTGPFTYRRFYTQTSWHRDAFTHRPFDTQKLLHTDPFTHTHTR